MEIIENGKKTATVTTIEKLRLLISYRRAGKDYVSPSQAAPVLGCDPYSLNIAAKLGQMPAGSCYFAGRNLRVSVRWLMEMAGFTAKKRPRRRCSASRGQRTNEQVHYSTEERETQAHEHGNV